MQGDRSLADIGTITAAVTDGRSRNEQYQGLQLAKLCWLGLSLSDKQDIREAIERTAMEEPDSDLWRLAQEILILLSA